MARGQDADSLLKKIAKLESDVEVWKDRHKKLVELRSKSFDKIQINQEMQNTILGLQLELSQSLGSIDQLKSKLSASVRENKSLKNKIASLRRKAKQSSRNAENTQNELSIIEVDNIYL